MRLRRGSGPLALVAVAAVLTAGLTASLTATLTVVPASAAVPAQLTDVNASAAATAVALPVTPAVDAVSVYQIGDLTPFVRDLALGAAHAAGAPAVVGRSFTGLMSGVTRSGLGVQLASGPGWAFPMAVTALPLDAIGAVMGRDVASAVARGTLVMGQTSANLRGAHVGDVAWFVGGFGVVRTFVIGMIVPDATIGGTEIVMSNAMADLLGQTAESRVLIYGRFDRARVDAWLATNGLLGNPVIGVSHSWDPPNPDSTLSLATTKAIMGEFDFYYAGITPTGWTAINPAWVAKYVPTKDLYARGISARCNIVVKTDLRAALDEVQATYPTLFNVWTGIDVANTNRFGGCSNNGEARFARDTTNISRHSWGQPIDTSTVANAQGGTPVMDCRIVRIFRKHNFAWGGNFLRPDGMHFEWVGTPRNAIQYPSKYCPNLPAGQIQAIGRVQPTGGLGSLFANDGLSGE